MNTAGAPGRAAPITIMLVDDHAIVRQGLRSLLGREDDLDVVAEASNPADALLLAAEMEPDVAVVDLKLSGSTELEGISTCEALSRCHPGCSVLVLTTFLDDELVGRAVKAGARGYIVKDVDTTELVGAIRAVHAGGSAFDPSSAAAMVRSLTAIAPASSTPTLTDRELEVLRELAAGRSNRAIGDALFISEYTAKFHVGNIIRKLGATSRAEAVYLATRNGLL